MISRTKNNRREIRLSAEDAKAICDAAEAAWRNAPTRTKVVTFLWRGDKTTRRVFLIGGIPGGDETLDRLEGTDVWYLSEKIPVRARFGYMFLVNYPKMVSGDWSRNPMPRPDPLNSARMGLQSIVELPKAPPQPWLQERPGVIVPKITEVPVRSANLSAAPPV